MNLTAIFLTGLATGGLTCMAVQGGLLAATIAQRTEDKIKNGLKTQGQALPIISFLLAKIIAYTILGFFLGMFGSFFQLSITAKVILQIAVGIFMIGTALNLLNIHPIFRYFIIQPPKFLTRIIRSQTKSSDTFAPFILGAFTVFIPCGTTQAMMALAMGSANAFQAAMIMFSFTLGTSPVFFILGYFASRLGRMLENSFMKIAAFVIIILAIFNINSALLLTSSPFSLQSIYNDLLCTILSVCPQKVLSLKNQDIGGEYTINFSDSGYSPDNISIKTGSSVKLHLVNNDAGGCIQAFVIPKLNIQKIVRKGTSHTIEFKAPDNPQDINFSCSMGMYQGVIHVI